MRADGLAVRKTKAHSTGQIGLQRQGHVADEEKNEGNQEGQNERTLH